MHTSRTDAGRTRVDVKVFPLQDQLRDDIQPAVPLISIGCHCYAFENTILIRKGNEHRCKRTDPSFFRDIYYIFFSVEASFLYYYYRKNICAEFVSIFIHQL